MSTVTRTRVGVPRTTDGFMQWFTTTHLADLLERLDGAAGRLHGITDMTVPSAADVSKLLRSGLYATQPAARKYADHPLRAAERLAVIHTATRPHEPSDDGRRWDYNRYATTLFGGPSATSRVNQGYTLWDDATWVALNVAYALEAAGLGADLATETTTLQGAIESWRAHAR